MFAISRVATILVTILGGQAYWNSDVYGGGELAGHEPGAVLGSAAFLILDYNYVPRPTSLSRFLVTCQ